MNEGNLDAIYALQEELQMRFPKRVDLTLELLTTIYLASKSSHGLLFVTITNELQDKDLSNFIVNWNFDEPDGQSVTPITMAAMAGNVNFVHILLNQYNIDLERECTVIFDGLVVYGATALWVAAGMGHLHIVKMLVSHGADVNHNTKAQSSPLRAACYEGRLDIVKYLIEHGADVNLANTYNNTCIMIAAYKGHLDVVDTLLKSGANPNEQALCGATALHYAAECGHLDVCVMLLNNGAVLMKNENGLTPVLHAAGSLHSAVVEMFIEREGLLQNEEIIEALELMGATFANDKDHYDLNKCFTLLRRAMNMRYEDATNIIRKKVLPPIPAYCHHFESENIHELQAMRLNHHSLHMETLTIRERILGKNNPELPQPIVYRGAVMADMGRFKQCMELWSYAIDLRMINNISVERDLLRFAHLFMQMLRGENEILAISSVLAILMKCHTEIEKNKYRSEYPGPKDVPRLLLDQNEQNIITALYLIKIVAKLSARLKNELKREDIEQIYSTLRKFITINTRLGDGQTLLHLAVNAITPVDEFYTNDVCRFPCYRTAMLLIHAGANVLAVDHDRNTALHTLVHTTSLQSTVTPLATFEKIVDLLINAGVHLDAVNSNGLRADQIYGRSRLENFILARMNNATTLKCLAARCIAVHKLRYRGAVPVMLESFIEMHSAEKNVP